MSYKTNQVIPVDAIRKGVPLAEDGRKRGRPDRYPFKAMDVGDSFVVPANGSKDDTNGKAYGRVASAAHASGRKLGRKYTVRSTGEGVATVWRVE